MAALKEMIKRPANSPPRRKKKSAPAKPMTHRPEWNSTPLRGQPPALRGIKTNREPWAKDLDIYDRGMTGHGAKPNKSPQRGKTPPSPEQMEAQYQDEYNKWVRRTGWNATPFRNAPDPIKGLKPVTREPWYEDMAIVRARRPRQYLPSASRPDRHTPRGPSAAPARCTAPQRRPAPRVRVL